MQAPEKLSLEQIRAFLEASEEVVQFADQNREEVYKWVNTTLRQHDYERLGRAAKGLLHRFIEKMTGYGRAQTTRLIQQYGDGEVKVKSYRRNRFAARFTRADIELLAQVDEAHETVSGPATQKLLQRAYYDFSEKKIHLLATISGAHLDRLHASPFDNERVAELLNKLLAEQTKSRPRHSNDNGLAESKNGWVIRKHIGYGHIASAHAEAFDRFYREHFNPYLNFHRPCGVPEMVVMEKGKQKRVYRWYATPWEILRQLPGLAGFLRAELTADQLQKAAAAKSDTQAAADMQEAKRKLFARLHRKRSA